jgi:hypothetical protein
LFDAQRVIARAGSNNSSGPEALSVIGSLRRGTPGPLYKGFRSEYQVPFEVWAQDDRTR